MGSSSTDATTAARVVRRSFRLVVPFAVAAIALSVSDASLAQSPGTFVPRDESPEEYPEGAGRDETFYFCTACHGFKIVAQQGQSRRQWDETLDFMTDKHGMSKLEGDDRKLMLDYLESSFPPRAPTRGWQNPFLK